MLVVGRKLRMRAFWYFLTFVFGFLGCLGTARSIEYVINGVPPQPAGVVLALAFLLVAWQCLRKARSVSKPPAKGS